MFIAREMIDLAHSMRTVTWSHRTPALPAPRAAYRGTDGTVCSPGRVTWDGCCDLGQARSGRTALAHF